MEVNCPRCQVSFEAGEFPPNGKKRLTCPICRTRFEMNVQATILPPEDEAPETEAKRKEDEKRQQAEAERKAEEKRKEDEKRQREDDERKRKEEEKRKQEEADAKSKAEEKRKEDEKRQREDDERKRKEEEKRKQEEADAKRKAEEKRKEDEKRQREDDERKRKAEEKRKEEKAAKGTAAIEEGDDTGAVSAFFEKKTDLKELRDAVIEPDFSELDAMDPGTSKKKYLMLALVILGFLVLGSVVIAVITSNVSEKSEQSRGRGEYVAEKSKAQVAEREENASAAARVPVKTFDQAKPPVPAEAAKPAEAPAPAKPEAAPAPEPKPDPKAEAKAEPAKPEPKPEAKPAAKAEAKPEPKAEPKAETKAPAVGKSAKEYYKDGNDLIKQGQFEAAVAEYKKALAQDPNFAVAHRGLGVAYASLKRTEDAVREYRAYLRLAPNAPDAEQVKKILGE